MGKLDETIDKLEDKVASLIDEFEKNPIRTSIRVLVTCWVLKTVYTWVKQGMKR